MPALSIVLPMHDAAAFAAERVAWLLERLDESFGVEESGGGGYEVVVVDDGSSDGSVAALAAVEHPALRVFEQRTNTGKFGALQRGVAEARGDAIGFTDIDVPYDPAFWPYAHDLVARRGFHLAVGDRTLPESAPTAHAGVGRHLTSVLFAHLVRLVVTGGIYDTQCGIKAFRGDVAKALFAALHERGFAGDVELLYLALKHNLAIRRVPVRLVHTGPSSVRVGRDGLDMLFALGRIVWRYRRGRYETDALAALGRQDAARGAEAERRRDAV